MDVQVSTGTDLFRSLLVRAAVVIGAVIGGTALAWLLSSASASAAESPVTGLVSTATSVVDNTVHVGQDAAEATKVLPAAAPSVPQLQVGMPHLVAPVLLVEQRLHDLNPAEPADEVVHLAPTRAFVPSLGSNAVHGAAKAAPVARIDHPATPVVPVIAQAGLATAPSTATAPHPASPSSEALPFGAPPNGAVGHDGPSGSAGACLGDGVPVIAAASSVLPSRTVSQFVPMSARRQPGITPD
jgi:hypothetical protein